MAIPKQRVVPALRITNYARSKIFYIDGLGFSIGWEHRFEPHFPVFLSISFDGMEIFLSEHSGDCQVGGLVHFDVPDVDAIYAAFRSRGIAVKGPPTESLEGMRDMTVVDPDGNQLRFTCDWISAPPNQTRYLTDPARPTARSSRRTESHRACSVTFAGLRHL